jgi:hypothetical protein
LEGFNRQKSGGKTIFKKIKILHFGFQVCVYVGGGKKRGKRKKNG